MDRGMKKFNSFRALTEHTEEINDLYETKKKIDKPVLDEEEWEIINSNISYAMENHYAVKVTYYDLGYIKEKEGNLKVDVVYKLLLVDKLPIKFINVLKVEVLD